MHSRDVTFIVVGLAIGAVGIVGTIVWSMKVGVLAFLVLGVLILGLVVLQRRQLARIQQRTLSLLNTTRALGSESKISVLEPGTSREIAVSTKKIIGMLEAQRVGMDILNEKVEKALSVKDHSPDLY